MPAEARASSLASLDFWRCNEAWGPKRTHETEQGTPAMIRGQSEASGCVHHLNQTFPPILHALPHASYARVSARTPEMTTTDLTTDAATAVSATGMTATCGRQALTKRPSHALRRRCRCSRLTERYQRACAYAGEPIITRSRVHQQAHTVNEQVKTTAPRSKRTLVRSRSGRSSHLERVRQLPDNAWNMSVSSLELRRSASRTAEPPPDTRTRARDGQRLSLRPEKNNIEPIVWGFVHFLPPVFPWPILVSRP